MVLSGEGADEILNYWVFRNAPSGAGIPKEND